MLLRLVPTPPLPTILFTLALPTFPSKLPLPPAWDAQLQLLSNTQLSAPPSLHALDKSVAWTVLLESVTFDLASLTVACVFIDGTREEWPLTNRCVDLLESVVCDVNRSAAQADREQQPPPVDDQPPPKPKPKPKPKKRRSIIASLMASLASSSSSQPPAPPAPTPPPPPSPDCSTTLPARFLRRRARSTLVDTFRRFVVAELSPRFRTTATTVLAPNPQQPPHYALWIARSTARRAADEIARVIDDALTPDSERDDNSTDSSSSSSLHTPSDSHSLTPPAVLPPAAYHTYLALRAIHDHQHDLIHALVAHAAAQEQGSSAEAAVLEVRSRRRAWSTKEYLCSGASIALIGLAVPVRSSPLCRGWVPDEAGVGKREAVVRRARSLWDEGGGGMVSVSLGLRSREAEDVQVVHVTRGLERLSVRRYDVEDDEDEREQDEFLPTPSHGARLLEHLSLSRPKSPPPWHTTIDGDLPTDPASALMPAIETT